MEALKAEIAKKRKELVDSKLIGPDKKYFKRSDLLAKEEEEHRKKIAALRGDGAESKNTDDIVSRVSIFTSSRDVDDKILPRKEVIKRLRERNQPILLFGETLVEAFNRLRQLEVAEPECEKGFRNDFQEAMEQVDQQYLNELMKSKNNGDDEDKKKAHDVAVEEMKTNIDEIRDLAVNLGRRKDDKSQDCNIICTLFKFLLELWGKKLNSREEEDKISTAGKIESATYTQTQAYLKPLFKQLKNNKIADDILKHLTLIVKYTLDRDYVKANDAYLRMAIGNAPWPIGVTMVGIHARTGREKIFSANIAHVLNDETQRKYIQALKRLITKCQRFFPADPSRCVEYNAI
ncbi:pre-mRNA-splicing factor 18-like [Panonychus citri]|uniref:pre-mRNA-splicing factor 18-like n=1 Tax=Panonychus citri TaxID=50023 RepID=UPI0023076DC7|nr:pre-mRNA-splicing factor 18-like [Panonychus citri]